MIDTAELIYTPAEATRMLLAAVIYDDAVSFAAIVADVVSSPRDAISVVVEQLARVAASGIVTAAHHAGVTSADHVAAHFVRAAP